MFVTIMQFPPIQDGKEAEFREWFAWSNAQYPRHDGFVRRRLLQPRGGGGYVAVVEHESYETFMAMHRSPAQAEAGQRLKSLLAGGPQAAFYELVAL